MNILDRNEEIFLFYGVYDVKQLLSNKAHLIPCIFKNENPWQREIQIYKCLENLISNLEKNENNIFGLFSDSLIERTCLDSKIIKKFIKENKKEIFLFSPFQYNSLIFYNFWDQAEISHEGIIEETKKIYSLNKKFPNIDIYSRTSNIGFSYCNYWAAKKDSFLKIVRQMISIKKIMLENNLGYKETYHKSPFKEEFNATYKKTYKLFPFIIERYMSSLLLDSKNNFHDKVFYWKDTRHPLEQVGEIKELKEVLRNPIIRGHDYLDKGTIFKNKEDFYKKIWFEEDIEKLDKFCPGGGIRLKKLAKITS